jgi:hypothetical protein
MPQSIPNATLTTLAFEADLGQNADAFDVSNPTRLGVLKGGPASVRFSVEWAANGEGTRYLALRSSRPPFLMATPKMPTTVELGLEEVLRLETGDQIEALAYQDSGGALGVERAVVRVRRR